MHVLCWVDPHPTPPAPRYLFTTCFIRDACPQVAHKTKVKKLRKTLRKVAQTLTIFAKRCSGFGLAAQKLPVKNQH